MFSCKSPPFSFFCIYNHRVSFSSLLLTPATSRDDISALSSTAYSSDLGCLTACSSPKRSTNMKASLQPSTKLQNTSLVDKNYHMIHLHIPSLTLILPLPKLHAVHFRSIFSNPPNHPITSLGHPPSSSPSLVQTPKPADHRRDPTPSLPRGLPG